MPQKKGASKTVLQKPSVFGDDSDDEVGWHHLVQVFAVLGKVDRFLKDQITYPGMSWHVGCHLFSHSKYVTFFFFSDISWGESAKGICEKEDDEAGERKSQMT